jgi:deoxyribonuclease IV
MSILVGPAGSDGLGNLKGVEKVARLGLDCMEVAFVYGVRMRPADAEALGALARAKGIALSVHAPYYINLAADDPAKQTASRMRILESCRMAALMGARNVVFHAGFYQDLSPEQAFARIAAAIEDLRAAVADNGWPVALCPETTGKPSQFGSLDEVLRLARATGCGFTIDFAHLFARAAGALDFRTVLDRLPGRFHAHFTGIDYGPKGERRHLPTTPAFFRPLAEELLRRRLAVTLINESPRSYRDAAMMKRVLTSLLSS